MRILLIGQAAFAEQVLVRLADGGHEIAAVVCPPDRGPKPDPTKAAALQRGVPVHQFASLRGSEARDAFVAADADLAVLAYVTQIVPEPLLAVPRLGSICFHPSLLPRYRGGSAISWQLIRGETTTGVTVFWPDAGIDTGPILLQRSAPVGPDDTAGSLYYRTLFPLGVDAVVEAVELISAGRAPRIPQDESKATYDPLLTDAHAAIDWTAPTAQVHNLVRGCDPQPGAHTTAGTARVRLFEPSRVSGLALAPPGTVVALDESGVTVATGDGALRAARARGGGPKAAAADVLRDLGVTVGMRLGV
ncbi:MAG TPA: methionyl-tRNA formyltransferase [Candidatus Limnocylindria bacterium]|nr:methionyl-tRNA formyltransferase [Candidatus Limnocylindria bacterium]